MTDLVDTVTADRVRLGRLPLPIVRRMVPQLEADLEQALWGLAEAQAPGRRAELVEALAVAACAACDARRRLDDGR